MFKTLQRFRNQETEFLRERISEEAKAGNREAGALLTFMEGIRSFAFYEALRTLMQDKGLSADALVDQGRFTEIIRCLLSKEGLGYANLPKGLLPFHLYPWGIRTAFEEHLVEAAAYVADREGRCRLHMTVSEEHLAAFQALFESVKPDYEKALKVTFDVGFSVQDRSTDTLAVRPDGQPFRDHGGRLLFRPGGHGALLQNLNQLRGDVVFIKNIDNVLPDHLKEDTVTWKKILGGYLVEIQKRLSHFQEKLASGSEENPFLEEVLAFVKEEIRLSLPDSLDRASAAEKRSLLQELLYRPIRVCGMVKNVGEPGGGPFWIQDRTGAISRQIVEQAQVDMQSEGQQAIWESATHFNPVDLVCGVRDWRGKPYDLNAYVDPEAVFISKKSRDGKELKALEHPGLWNGGMAHWITLFVETPITTFSPIKTVNDLLRREHQPD
jgi:hypothetical protein